MASTSGNIGALLVVTAMSSSASATDCNPPPWFKGSTVSRDGDILVVVCDGEGATTDLAEIEARDRCDSRAALEFRSSISVKELAVATDHDAALHVETTAQASVLDLACNKPKSISCERNGGTHAWRQCTYDLSKAKSGPQKTPVSPATTYRRSKDYVLSISTTPSCDDVIVDGSNGRRLKCNRNPMQLTIKPGDTNVIVRAKGYLPKTIELGGASREGSVDVFLDTVD